MKGHSFAAPCSMIMNENSSFKACNLHSKYPNFRSNTAKKSSFSASQCTFLVLLRRLQKQAMFINQFGEGLIWNNVVIVAKQPGSFNLEQATQGIINILCHFYKHVAQNTYTKFNINKFSLNNITGM